MEEAEEEEANGGKKKKKRKRTQDALRRTRTKEDLTPKAVGRGGAGGGDAVKG